MTKPSPYLNIDYVFGPVIGASDIDIILYNIIQKWQITYLREVARRAGESPDELRPFRSWRVSHELERMNEDQTPALIIANLGLIDEPMKQGTLHPGKAYYGIWRYQFGCLISARGKKQQAATRANYLAKLYALAMRLILIQKRDDDSVLGMHDWVDEGYDGLEPEDDRTLCLAHTDFNISVPNVASWATGPREPDILPDPEPLPPTWPWVVTHKETIVKVPTNEEIPE